MSDIVSIVKQYAEPFENIENASVDGFIERSKDARVILLGEATHGTSEFYRMRAHLTKELIKRSGVSIVFIEWDWTSLAEGKLVSRFPSWMWNNREFNEFVAWINEQNSIPSNKPIYLYGIDLYCLRSAIEAVIGYLDRTQNPLAEKIGQLYSGLYAQSSNFYDYHRAVHSGQSKTYKEEVMAAWQEVEKLSGTGHEFFAFLQNARLVARAEETYRTFHDGVANWNIRDQHMFETLDAALQFHGKDSKAVVWAHNSHNGNGLATGMRNNGMINLGRLCYEHYGDASYRVGFGFHHGTVVAAPQWDGPHSTITTKPARTDSYENIFHETGLPSFLLPLRKEGAHRQALLEPRLERGIGSVFQPEGELTDNYYQAVLPDQFDEYIWFDETTGLHY